MLGLCKLMITMLMSTAWACTAQAQIGSPVATISYYR